MPHRRYRVNPQVAAVDLPDRTWPSRRLTAAPLWVPVDLRDGNQALPQPMDTERKVRLFRLMVAMGFKEIEVGYPSASSLDFDFVRLLARGDLVPDDVTVVVFTPARDDLISRTIESVQGLGRVVIHLCIATAPKWRGMVLGHDRASLQRHIVSCAQHILRRSAGLDDTDVRFQFSPEAFNVTERDYALDICNAVTEVWSASPERPVTINLPTTVEVATPNIFADQVEWMHRHLARREGVILSVHPHNDRGTAVASAELGLLAGAQRVEGCLFGNGERTGNVDLVTLALNLFSQGIDPELDLSDIDEVRRVVEECTRIAVPERHPYVGNLVFTAFSGTHQDAIGKGIEERDRHASERGLAARSTPWDIPYLPVDPADLGRSYDAVIRVNSQSGKGGIAHLLEKESGLRPPRGLLQEFAIVAQNLSESSAQGGELTGRALWSQFRSEYLDGGSSFELSNAIVKVVDDAHHVTATARTNTWTRSLAGTGPNTVEAVADALIRDGLCEGLVEYHLHDGGHVGQTAISVSIQHHGTPHWGIGVGEIDADIATAAFTSALNRCSRACPSSIMPESEHRQ